ncbi:MAG: hypothetical protein RI894_2045 [Bacteroidota bacterium]
MNRILSLSVLVLLASTVFAQKDWQALKKEAEAADKKGNFGEAGNLYMDAYKQKEKNELAEKAADCFRRGHEYGGLAGALEVLKSSSHDKKIGFEYANALKQSGKYTDAIREFQLYINNYRGGKDYDTEEQRVNMQIQGCNLAIKAQKEGITGFPPERIAKLCSDQSESSPRTNGTTELYFASAMDGGKSKIFRSEHNSSGWTKPSTAFQFKGFEENIGNITFCTESKRMYFTQFTTDKAGKVTSQIYGSEEKNGEWGTPVKLPDFINAKDATATQPFVMVADGKEQLFFVSDRKGGQGGLDIWIASRNIQSDGFAFTLPINAGPGVNTASDEVTPTRIGNELYFSSNGLASVGGFDIFKATKKEEEWGFAENMGMPLNSSADDIYYTKNTDNTYFFVSNRLVKGQKAWYKDDDIFTNGSAAAAAPAPVNAQIVGNVVDIAKSSGNLTNVTVALIDVTSGGKEIANLLSKDGKFTFSVKPQMEYRVDTHKDGYSVGKFEVKTNAFTAPIEFPAQVEMARITDYKGKEGKIGEHEPIDELTPAVEEALATKNDEKSKAIAAANGYDSDPPSPKRETEPTPTKRESEIKPILDETLNFSDLTAEQKDDIITLNGIEVLQVENGYKPIVRSKKVISTPVVTSTVQGKKEPRKMPKKNDDDDAANDDNGGNLTAMSDTKEGTPEKVEPTKTAEATKNATTKDATTKDATTKDAIAGSLTQKIQIAAETPGKYAKTKYDFLAKMGANLETEPGPNGIERIIAVPTDGNAKALLKKIQGMPAYKGAFIAKYKNGVRI